jgi:DNA polymerase eta
MYGTLFLNDLLCFLEEETRLLSSGGIGSNKLQAKVLCQLNKPNKVTVCGEWPFLPRVSRRVPIPSIPGLGGSTGEALMASFKVDSMHEITKLNFNKLESFFGPELSRKIYNWGFGVDNTPVFDKQMNDTIRCNMPANSELNFSVKRKYYRILK